jgi:hypothetical protein
MVFYKRDQKVCIKDKNLNSARCDSSGGSFSRTLLSANPAQRSSRTCPQAGMATQLSEVRIKLPLQKPEF